jgi:hypothetical protein
MVFSCHAKHIVTFLNKEGVELFQIYEDKIGSRTYDTLYNNMFCMAGKYHSTIW